ncbi:TSC complex subunit 1a isoform X1 [Paramormyrops kingsleyae]|uniref:TSC complex subunit 1a isoform X1 n=1 Tax=Paramormyrops kingsleyae TaxID=1676925 RepID=UPI000CD64010|nr:hamartin isoform X1 [Paramormyrops kingsleyae]
MSREQFNIGDVLPLLESSDLHELDEIKSLINEHLSTDRGSVLLNSLVDYYLETGSPQTQHILSSVREPHDKHLLEKINECMNKQACRLHALTLLGHIIRKQPPWIHKIARFPLFSSLLKCLKTDSNIVVLITGVLVLITLLPIVPQVGKQHLCEFFDIFGRLAAWSPKNQGHVTDVYLIHLHASVYSLLHRLYGMFPCNFVSYLRSHYSMKENMDTFEEVVKPMLEHVRIHPELVTGTKDHELDPTRWKRFEVHDIVIECAKVSLDPKEASCEEGYVNIPERSHPPLKLRYLDCTTSPYSDLHTSFGSSSSTSFSALRQPLPLPLTLPFHQSPQSSRRQNGDVGTSGGKDLIWSPSSVCGMTTPPSSRGISPTNVTDLSQSASYLQGRVHGMLAGGKRTPCSSTPGTSSSTPTLSDEFIHISLAPSVAEPPNKDGRALEHPRPSLVRQEPVKETEKSRPEMAPPRDGSTESMKTMTLPELSLFIKKQELELRERTEKEREEDAITEELQKITAEQCEPPVLRGVDSPFYRTTEMLTGIREKPQVPVLPGLPAELRHAASTPDRPDGPPQPSERHVPWSFTPIDRSLPGHTPHSPLVPDEEAVGLLSPSPCRGGAVPAYESLFDLALPRAALVYVAKRTSEAQRVAGGEVEPEEKEGEGVAATSPLEVLDRLIQQGSDAHDKVLRRLPLPSKSADWTHFGGSAPLDELHTLRSQLILLHSQLLYERYKREQHAVRNRRLLRRIINATALEEQNIAMKDQLKLQDVEIQSLQASLQVEQQRYQQLWEDRESVVTRLYSQVRQLQQSRDEHYGRHQELQTKLQECQRRTGELEAELQRANNRVCNTGHQLSQLSVKLTNSEALRQQMGFLNKQLLLLGEVNKFCVKELQHLGPDTRKEAEMLRASTRKEIDKLQQSMLQQSQRLEAAQQRIGDLEVQLTKKEHLIVEQKLFLEDVKSQAKGQLQASENRYQAQKQVSQLLQTELLQLYGRLETKSPSAGSLPAEGGAEPLAATEFSDGIPVPTGQVKAGTRAGACGPFEPPTDNGCTLSPGKPQSGMAASLNGSLEPRAQAPGPSPSHLPFLTPLPGNTPLTVGSYPSAKSFLGMRARELFRNKSESQCDGDLPPPACIPQGSKTEKSVELVGNPAPCPAVISALQGTVATQVLAQAAPIKGTQADGEQKASIQDVPRLGGTWQRQQQLRIMDYNETHH